MITVFSGVEGIDLPSFSEGNYHAKADKYVQDIQDYARKNGKGADRGKIVAYQVADGYATYVILKPTTLIHINTWDGWHYDHITRFSAKEISADARKWENLKSMFA